MPEITGDQDIEALPEAADDLDQKTWFEARSLDHRGCDLTEVTVPPSRLRLDDFSGEGERAPPE
jgi:hypothetical protein